MTSGIQSSSLEDSPTPTLGWSVSRLLRFAGSVLAVLALLFFVSALLRGFRSEELQRMLGESPIRFLILHGSSAVLAFLVCNISGAFGWRALLRSLGSAMPLRSLLAVYFLSVPGKYLPGNVGHFIGRGVLAKPFGISLSRSGLSFLLESAILASVATAIAIPLAAPVRALYRSSAAPSGALSNTEIVILFAFGIMAAVAASELLRLRGVLLPSRTTMLGGVLLAAALNLSCFVLLGGLVCLLMPAGALDYWTATSIFALAFVAGFVVPGAPAGVGVREAVFIAMVTEDLRPMAAATIALIRVAQMVADGITFLIGAKLRTWREDAIPLKSESSLAQ